MSSRPIVHHVPSFEWHHQVFYPEKKTSKKNTVINKYCNFLKQLNGQQKLKINLKLTSRGALQRETLKRSNRPALDRAVFGVIETIPMWTAIAKKMHNAPLWMTISIKLIL